MAVVVALMMGTGYLLHAYRYGTLPLPEGGGEVPTAPVAYIDRVVQSLATWDKENLKPLFVPETLAGSNDAQLDQVLSTLGNRLGGLKAYSPPVLDQRDAGSPVEDDLQTYRLLAYFDGGSADISLVLRQGPGAQRLYAFNVDVPRPPDVPQQL
ncbi:MAG TPA: hypothetical protein VNR18_02510 [Hyphomicrobiales bacterium]|nr:hypothetical protein [Hyphomicrobiales bacterium]